MGADIGDRAGLHRRGGDARGVRGSAPHIPGAEPGLPHAALVRTGRRIPGDQRSGTRRHGGAPQGSPQRGGGGGHRGHRRSDTGGVHDSRRHLRPAGRVRALLDQAGGVAHPRAGCSRRAPGNRYDSCRVGFGGRRDAPGLPFGPATGDPGSGSGWWWWRCSSR